MEIGNEEKQERTYRNAWITDKTITRENVKELDEILRRVYTELSNASEGKELIQEKKQRSANPA